MPKKCLYCGKELSDSCVVDFCESCGIGVFGERMFKTIISNMEDARDRGDLCHSQDSTPENTQNTRGVSDNPVEGAVEKSKPQEDF